jgi:hypothetical protein
MIIFSWTLTPNQVLALRSVAEAHHRYEQAAKKKKALPWHENVPCANIKHFIGATRHLIKEGFIVHKEVELEPWEKQQLPQRFNNKRQAWEITAKGLLILQMVEIEVSQQAQLLKLDEKELKLLQESAA